MCRLGGMGGGVATLHGARPARRLTVGATGASPAFSTTIATSGRTGTCRATTGRRTSSTRGIVPRWRGATSVRTTGFTTLPAPHALCGPATAGGVAFLER